MHDSLIKRPDYGKSARQHINPLPAAEHGAVVPSCNSIACFLETLIRPSQLARALSAVRTDAPALLLSELLAGLQ
jgi:hypothetical protein